MDYITKKELAEIIDRAESDTGQIVNDSEGTVDADDCFLSMVHDAVNAKIAALSASPAPAPVEGELLPCPFCGVSLVKKDDYYIHPDTGDCYFSDSICIDDSDDNLKESAKAWNTRARLHPAKGLGVLDVLVKRAHDYLDANPCFGSDYPVAADIIKGFARLQEFGKRVEGGAA